MDDGASRQEGNPRRHGLHDTRRVKLGDVVIPAEGMDHLDGNQHEYGRSKRRQHMRSQAGGPVANLAFKPVDQARHTRCQQPRRHDAQGHIAVEGKLQQIVHSGRTYKMPFGCAGRPRLRRPRPWLPTRRAPPTGRDQYRHPARRTCRKFRPLSGDPSPSDRAGAHRSESGGRNQ